MECFLHNIAEILAAVCIGLIIGGDICIAGYTDIIPVRYLVLLEHNIQVLHNHLLYPYIADVMSWQVQDIRYELGYRYNSHHTPVVQLQIRHYIHLFIQQVGEGVVCVYNLGGQHGKDLLFEILLHKLPLLLLQFFKVQPTHTIRMELLLNLAVCLIPLFIKGGHCCIDGVQLFLGSHARFTVHRFIINRSHIIQAAHPYHKKLIQVTRENSDQFHPLQEVHALILCLLQHSLIKPEPGQLPVLCILYNLLSHINFLFLSLFFILKFQSTPGISAIIHRCLGYAGCPRPGQVYSGDILLMAEKFKPVQPGRRTLPDYFSIEQRTLSILSMLKMGKIPVSSAYSSRYSLSLVYSRSMSWYP